MRAVGIDRAFIRKFPSQLLVIRRTSLATGKLYLIIDDSSFSQLSDSAAFSTVCQKQRVECDSSSSSKSEEREMNLETPGCMC